MSCFSVFCFTSPVFQGLKERTPNACSASSGNHQHIFVWELHTCEVSCKQFVWEMMFCFPHLFICDVYWGGDNTLMKKNPGAGLIQNRHDFDQEPWERWQHLDRKSDEYKAGLGSNHLAPWVKHGTYTVYNIIYIYSGWQKTPIWQRFSPLESWYSRITGCKKKLPISNGQSPTYFATGENSWGTTLMLPTYPLA